MNALTGCIGIADNWLVDGSELLSDGKTRVILYNPDDELECKDIVLKLEGLTIGEICKTQVTFEDIRRYKQFAKLGYLRAFLAL